jgi:hypothetical protein
VFDMAIQQTHRTLRVATHGRGIWERLLDADVTAVASLVRSEVSGGRVRLSWHTDLAPGVEARLYRRVVPGEWTRLATLRVDPAGDLAYEDGAVSAQGVYDYRLGVMERGREVFAGDVRVDVGAANRLAVGGANPSTSGLRVTFVLPLAMPASLELVDATGRRVFRREVGSMGVGRHELDLRGERLSPGVDWARLVQGDRLSSAKLVVLASGSR